jgi:type I restriction enzyme S subunit
MKTAKTLIPQLRFPEFEGLWKSKKYNQIYTFYSTNSFSREKLNYENGEVKNIHYGDIHTKFATLFDIEKEYVPFVNSDIDLSKIKDENFCQEGDLLIADASEDYNDIGKTTEIVNLNNKKLISGLHTFHARPNKYKMAKGFAGYLLQSWKVRRQVMTIAQGTKVLSLATSRLGNIDLIITSIEEQQKIASFLTEIDDKITKLTKKKTLLEQYQKGVMQKIFNQELRFKNDIGNAFPKWQMKKLGVLLDYEQPTKYIVKSTEYNDSFKTPVLTAGKSFLLGYTNETKGIYNKLPTIIFDDFTMANKFVDFEFKVKSSAMKILQPKTDEVNIKFVYEAIQMINYPKGDEHKRFWISEYSKIKIGYPCVEEQTKIANFLSDIDVKIEALNTKIEHSKAFKKGLLQQMFV